MRNVSGVDKPDWLGGRRYCQDIDGIAAKDGWREFQPKEALNMGFEELVNLSGNRCSCTGR